MKTEDFVGLSMKCYKINEGDQGKGNHGYSPSESAKEAGAWGICCTIGYELPIAS